LKKNSLDKKHHRASFNLADFKTLESYNWPVIVGGNECARVIKTTREPITGGILAVAAAAVCAVVVQLKAVPNKSKEKPNRYLYTSTRTCIAYERRRRIKKEKKKIQLKRKEIPNAPGMKKTERPSSSSSSSDEYDIGTHHIYIILNILILYYV